ncbi:MAG: single-stranded DNA-binding protein [Bacteroidales bacterium]|nr:single-stranded DNA-binding protein [Bacteroidales bacterium]
MEVLTINRVEILGRVGAEPRIAMAGSTRNAKFPVATNERYKDRGGALHEETTWHNVTIWQGPRTPAFEQLKKGSLVHIYGRIRNTKYKGIDGEDKYFSEVTANHLDIIKEDADQPAAPGGFR